MNNQRKIFTILPNGQKQEYDVILTFFNTKNNLSYVIYTDNTIDQNNKLRLYAGTFDERLANPYLGEPKTKEEWLNINAVLSQVISKNSIKTR